jgi:hypothetical protein
MVLVTMVIALLTLVGSKNVRVSDGGVLMEESGQVFMTDRRRTFRFRVVRAAPIDAYRGLTFQDCSEEHCLSLSSDRRDRKACSNTVSETSIEFFRVLNDTYVERIYEIMTEAHSLRSRQKRDILTGASLVLGIVKLGLQMSNHFAKRADRKLSLQNAENLRVLQRMLLESNEAVSLKLDQLYHYSAHIDRDLCETKVALRREVLEREVRNTVEQYMDQLETEAADLVKGLLPSTVEYLRLYRSSCEASCTALPQHQCTEYCGALLRNMPSKTRPVFAGVEIDSDFHVHLLFSLTFMEVSGPPSQRYSLKSFGMIRPGDNMNQAVRPQVAPFVTVVDSIFMDVDKGSCDIVGDSILLCESDALKWSCLNSPEACDIIETKTRDTCAFAVAANGIAVYSSETATVRTRVSKTGLQSSTAQFSGFKFFESTENFGEILCTRSMAEIQIISIQRVELVENITVFIDAPKGPHIFHYDLDGLKIDWNSTIQLSNEIEEEVEDLQYYGSLTAITIASASIVLFLGALFFAKRRTAQLFRRQRGITIDLNRLKPIGFEAETNHLLSTSRIPSSKL